MATIPFALSIHHFINSVGSDAGFASIIGLAILAFLYFAQMRETATLRERSEEDAERLRELEGRLTQLLRGQPGAAAGVTRQPPLAPGRIPGRPSPAVAAAPAASAQAATARPPSAVPAPMPRTAPAGVGAPALTAATKLIPIPQGADGPSSGAGGTALAAPPRPVPAPAPAPATVAGVNGGGASAGGSGALPRVPLGATAGGGGQRELPPLRELAPEPGGSSRGRRVLYGVLGLIVVVAIVAALVSITSGSTNSPSHRTTRTTNAPSARRSAAVVPGTVTVAVLNGTATFHVASDIAAQLQSAGFKRGEVTNAPAQTHQTTLVQYLPGRRADALAVARTLRLGAGRVSRIDAATQLAACPPQSGTCAAEVVVTVGADLATGAGASGWTTAGGSSTGPAGTAPTNTTP